jgi:hypothetical protein
VEKPEHHLKDLYIGNDNMKMDLIKIWLEGVDLIHLDQKLVNTATNL